MKTKFMIIMISLAAAIQVFAAGELWHCYESGNNLYVTLRKSDRTVYDANKGNNTWDTWNDSNLSEYVIDLTDRGGKYYDANIPADINTACEIRVMAYLKAGSSPSVNDLPIGTCSVSWSGSTELSMYVFATYITEMWLTSGGGFPP